MLMHTHTHDLERRGVQSETEFTIKTTAKSFEILSSGLYTDAITAIVRELSCNAHDAHIDANNVTTPFDIHLPNKLEPFFSIRDYGTGLSDADIQGSIVHHDPNDPTVTKRVGGLYTTYFESSKTESNDFIGALGLGSKSPFSYVDAFTVTSFFAGYKKVYSVFLNEHRIPSVALLLSQKSDELPGLEVSITVKVEDLWNFERVTSKTLQYFDVQPNVFGVSNFSFIQPPTPIITNGKLHILSHQNTYDKGSIVAVQGNVQYNVQMELLQDGLSTATVRMLRYVSLVIFFDMGELEVAASREELRYDNRTKQSLATIIDTVANVIVDSFYAVASKHINSKWNTFCAFTAQEKYLFSYSQTLYDVDAVGVDQDSMLFEYITNHGKIQMKLTHMECYSLVLYERNRQSDVIKRSELGICATPTPNVVIFRNDVNTGAVGRIKQYLHNTPNVNAVLLINEQDHKNANNKIAFAELQQQLGNPNIKLVSLDTTTVKRKMRTSAIFTYEGYGWNNSGSTIKWTRHNIQDITDSRNRLYFDIERARNINYNNRRINWMPIDVKNNFLAVLEIINKHNNTSYTIDDVYGMSLSAKKSIEHNDNWKNIFDVFHQSTIKYMPDIENIIKLERFHDPFEVISMLNVTHFMSNVDSLESDSEFRRIIVDVDSMQGNKSNDHKRATTVKSVRKLLQEILGVFVAKPDKIVDNLDMFKCYPMIQATGKISLYRYHIKELFDYIKLIDNNRNI